MSPEETLPRNCRDTLEPPVTLNLRPSTLGAAALSPAHSIPSVSLLAPKIRESCKGELCRGAFLSAHSPSSPEQFDRLTPCCTGLPCDLMSHVCFLPPPPVDL